MTRPLLGAIVGLACWALGATTTWYIIAKTGDLD